MRLALALGAWVVSASLLTAQAPQAPDPRARADARAILTEMIAARTTADGNTTPLAESLAARFR
ncbi:MAG: hypothetical protein RL139_1400, partial [Gemmatimonadota bacterium]